MINNDLNLIAEDLELNNLSFSNINIFINWLEHQRRNSKKVSLTKMIYYMSLFNNPHQKFASIHVAGTNGKGSVVANLRSILREAGFNIATFTSPYIICFNERICYNDEMIRDGDLLRLGNQILNKYPQIKEDGYELPTFFEFVTLMAFIYFSELKDLDLALIEVGIGGLLDSTNVITPLISVITNITLEHTKILGSTLEEIAVQKLGIIKEGKPLVTSNQNQKLQKLFQKYCDDHHSILYQTHPCEVEILKQDIYASEIILNGHQYTIGLAGNHQIENALCAIKTLDVLKGMDLKWNQKLTYEIYYRGLKKVKWQGRMEIVSTTPLILIDGCHNIAGVKTITDFIQRLDYQTKRAVISISNDKDKKEMLELISNTFDEVICTQYTYSRSTDVDDLYNLLNHHHKLKIKDPLEALEYCQSHLCDFTIFIGSLYLASEIRNIIKPQK